VTPDTDDATPCGPLDPSAFLLQPSHTDCSGCRAVIVELSQGRTPMAGSPVRQRFRTVEDPAPGWHPDLLFGGARK